jgi:hypothetical protein
VGGEQGRGEAGEGRDAVEGECNSCGGVWDRGKAGGSAEPAEGGGVRKRRAGGGESGTGILRGASAQLLIISRPSSTECTGSRGLPVHWSAARNRGKVGWSEAGTSGRGSEPVLAASTEVSREGWEVGGSGGQEGAGWVWDRGKEGG